MARMVRDSGGLSGAIGLLVIAAVVIVVVLVVAALAKYAFGGRDKRD